jgi:hypothetical protein
VHFVYLPHDRNFASTILYRRVPIIVENDTVLPGDILINKSGIFHKMFTHTFALLSFANPEVIVATHNCEQYNVYTRPV